MASALDFLTGIAGSQFDRARAKLTALVGQFFTYRDLLLQMRDRADYLSRKADRTSNAALNNAVTQLRPQIDGAYTDQVNLEGNVQGALQQVSAIQQGGSGVSVASLASAASTLVQLAAQIALHERKVAGIDSLLKQLESKTLTPAEIAQVRGGSSFGSLAAAGGAVMLGGAAVVLFLLFRRRKR